VVTRTQANSLVMTKEFLLFCPKKKATRFSVKVVCIGSHGRKQSPLELVLFIVAKLKDGTTIELHSPPFVIQGSRDNNREKRQLIKPPHTAPEPSPPSATTHDPSPVSNQTSTVDETDHQQIPKSPPDTPPVQPPDPEDLFLDFRGCRLAN